MKITISNDVRIEEPHDAIMQFCQSELTIDNPDYEKKQRLGLWVGNTPRKIRLFKMDGNTLICPIGAFKRIKGIIDELNIKTSYLTDLAPYKAIEYNNADMHLYDYQEDAVNAMLKRGYGILQSPAGSGKSNMALAMIFRAKSKALWLTHTNDLLNQSYDRACQFVDKKLLGKITGGKVQIGEGITFATVQTLSKQDMTQYKYVWDMVIADECHRLSGSPTKMTQFSKVVGNIAAPRKYGLSATVHRADGLIKETFALVGGISHIVPESAVADKVMQVTVKREDTNVSHLSADVLDTDGTIIYSKLISWLSEKTDRNNQIAEKLTENKEHYNLVLSDRLDQLRKIIGLMPDELKDDCVMIDGSMTSKKGKAQRNKAIEDMRNGKKHFLFASYRLAKEGLDIPRLDRLHLATPQKDYAIIVQSVGRIARTFDGKETPICYDYVDKVGIFERMYKQRCTSYRKCGCALK